MEDLEIKYTEAASGLAFDLRESQKELLDNFFKLDGTKVRFALKYVEIINEAETPGWISEILDYLN